MERPFGDRYRESIDSRFVEIPYDHQTQTARIDDTALKLLAASDNTLTFTGGPDNDFD